MTREQKLALIIGFSLILAVGVLISDHLSRAQSEPIVADQEIDQPMVVHRIADVPPGIGETVRPNAGRDAVQTDPGVGGSIREPLPGMDTAQADLKQSQPIEVSMLPRETPPRRDLSTADSNFVRAGNRELASADPASADMSAGMADLFERVDERPRPGIQTRSQFEQPRETTRSLNAQPRESRQQPASSPIKHVVDEGESLYAIAQRYYGDGNLWPRLVEANRSRVGEEGHVMVGAELVIPARQGSPRSIPTTQAPTTQSTRTAQAPRQTTPDNPEQFGTYVVQKGDTLSEISQELMGTVRRMNELIKLNSDQINDADDIRVGMKLRYPRGERA